MGIFTAVCSAGVGRTGTFCTIDTALRVGGSDEVVLKIIKHFRTQRCDIVETRVDNLYSFICII